MQREDAAHLRDLLGDIVSPIFDLWRYDGRLRCRRRVRLFFSRLREVECNQRDLVDGAVLVDVRIRGRAKEAGLHMIKGAWRGQWNTQRKFHLMQMHLARVDYLVGQPTHFHISSAHNKRQRFQHKIY